MAQGALKRHIVVGALRHGGGIKFARRGPFFFRATQRGIGIAQQASSVGVRVVSRMQRRSQAGAHKELVTVNGKRQPERV